MIFTPTPLAPAMLVDPEAVRDDRGSFARIFCTDEFARHGLPTRFAQCSISSNARRGTLRGLHYQAEPCAEGKLIRCIRGAAYDVMVELATRSWFAVELSAANGRAVYIPPGFAHGFQTLCDDTDLLYHMTVPYRPELSRGLHWNSLGIAWPITDPIVSARDAVLADFAER